MTVVRTRPARRRPPSSSRDLVVAALCASTVLVGGFKGTVLLSWAPVDPTLVVSVLVVLAAATKVLANPLAVRVPPIGLVLVASFVPGVLAFVPHGYHDAKVEGMALTLAIVVSSAFLLDSRLRRQFWLWSLGAGGVAMAAAVRVLPNDDGMWGRAVVEGSNTIATGRITGAAVVVFVVFLLQPRARHRLLLAGLVAATALTAVDTGSRGPVAFAAVALCLVAPLIREGRVVRILAIGLALVSAVVVVLLDDSPGAARLGSLLEGDGGTVDTRAPVWRAALRAIVDLPRGFAGTGWGGFISVLGPEETLDSGGRQHAHDMVLEVFVEGGWIAGVALLVFIVWSLVRLRRRAADPRELGVLAVALFAVLNALVSSDVAENRLAWVALALAWAAVDASGSGAPDDPVDQVARIEHVEPVRAVDAVVQGADQKIMGRSSSSSVSTARSTTTGT